MYKLVRFVSGIEYWDACNIDHLSTYCEKGVCEWGESIMDFAEGGIDFYFGYSFPKLMYFFTKIAFLRVCPVNYGLWERFCATKNAPYLLFDRVSCCHTLHVTLVCNGGAFFFVML